MTSSIIRNQQFLIDLFTGPFRGHALIAEPAGLQFDWSDGDVAISPRPVTEWVPQFVYNYEVLLKWHETLGDDNVPCASLTTGTELFAAAFGSPVHIFGDNMPCALPLVTTAEEADALVTPDLTARPLERIFELASIVREKVGPDVPIGVPDIQSPFDIAALIWRKEDFLVALYESPDAVKRLTMKCHTLLKEFITEFKRQIPNCNLCHHPRVWLPPELGCWLSEDEAGSMNAPMFREFCLPSLVDLSEAFNGLSMHCCATADHQYENFLAIPNLRGMNRSFQAPGPRPAIEAFSGKSVLILGANEQILDNLLEMALPDTRYLFNFISPSLDEGKAMFDRMRERCPRGD